ncbi:MAG: serine/threonine protein kinase [Gemmataceae bacterium]|nr:serine/threonine protein kinase [Gemmataceae bacterium]
MTATDDKIIDLLVQWDEARRQGKSLTPEQLVPDDESLREALRVRIEKRQRLEALVDLPQATVHESKAPPASAPPALNGFEMLELIGRGGMGVVYKARHLGLGRIVAVKMILAGAGASREELARFRTEAEAVARLHHPNIVQIHEVGQQADCPYLVLEHVGGGSLADLLARGPIEPRLAAELILTLAQAVHHAHENHIVHRDLKPANILLQIADRRSQIEDPPLPSQSAICHWQSAIPKIADFGLAKRLDAERGFTQTGAVLGSPAYMSPEQASGRVHDVGPATDIYALGAILYEALTGRSVFSGDTVLETLEQVRQHDPTPPRKWQPNVPADLETICLKCLQKEPADRYRSAAALAHDVSAFLAGDPISARDFTLYDHLARTIAHTSIDPRFGTWALRALMLSPLPIAVHLLAFLVCRDWPQYAALMIGATVLTVTIMVSFILSGNRALMRQMPRVQRRHLTTVLIGNLLGCFMMLAVVLLTARVEQPEDLFMVYPIWVVMTGISMFALASQAGWHYISGLVFWGTALAMALFPRWAPLMVGLLASSNLLWQGLHLRRLAANEGQRITTGRDALS